MAAVALISASALRTGIEAPPATSAATAVWASVVDRYIEEQLTPEGTLRGVQLAGRLDPTWAQPWFFGILMVPPGAPERQELAAHAAAVHPDVRWFTDQVQR